MRSGLARDEGGGCTIPEMDSIRAWGTARGRGGVPDRGVRKHIPVHLTCPKEDLTAKRHRLGEAYSRG